MSGLLMSRQGMQGMGRANGMRQEAFGMAEKGRRLSVHRSTHLLCGIIPINWGGIHCSSCVFCGDTQHRNEGLESFCESSAATVGLNCFFFFY